MKTISPRRSCTNLSTLCRHLHISKVSRCPQRSQLSSLTQLKALALSSLDEQQIIQAACEPPEMEVRREQSAQSTDEISRHLGAIKLLQPMRWTPVSREPSLSMLCMLGMECFQIMWVTADRMKTD